METEATGEPAVTIEMSETDTESFEDLGPRVALANGGITQAEVTTIPSVEEIPVGTLINSPLDPPTVNISNASLTVPATSGVVRRSIDVESRFLLPLKTDKNRNKGIRSDDRCCTNGSSDRFDRKRKR